MEATKRKQYTMPRTELDKILNYNAKVREQKYVTIYQDNLWKIDLDIGVWNKARIWVMRDYEETRNSFNCSLCTVYEYNGELKTSCDFPLPDKIIKKVHSFYRFLHDKNAI